MKTEILNTDSYTFLSNIKDNYYDIVIADPPYGIGQNWRKDKTSKFYSLKNNFNNTRPDKKIFDQIFRVSKNQIIFGYNYFADFLPLTNSLIFWDKGKDAQKQHGSAGELIWTSFNFPLRKYNYSWCGCATCEKITRIHPHQKPVMLYSRLLHDFAEEENKILDPFLGSGTSAIAAQKDNRNLFFTGIEKDFLFYQNAKKFIEKETKQTYFNFLLDQENK